MIPMKRINIELTPQELELALTLTKQAGCKSIEDFFRLTLSRASGGQSGSGLPHQSGEPRERVKRVNAELRRLHKELRGFLSESALVSSSNAASAGPFMHGPAHPRTSAEAGPTRQEGVPGSAPLSPAHLNAPVPGEVPAPGSPNIQLGYDRRAPGFNFKTEDELEDMAGAAFKNSPQLGFSSPGTAGGPTSPTTVTESIEAQSEEGGYIEDLVDEEPQAEKLSAGEQGRFVVSVSIDDILAVRQSDPIIVSVGKQEAPGSNEPVNSLADELVAAVAENPVEGERPASNEGTDPVKEEESEDKAQNADSEVVPSEVVKSDQIKLPGISGNLPPRKRKT
jgi:hypothetical protein